MTKKQRERRKAALELLTRPLTQAELDRMRPAVDAMLARYAARRTA